MEEILKLLPSLDPDSRKHPTKTMLKIKLFIMKMFTTGFNGKMIHVQKQEGLCVVWLADPVNCPADTDRTEAAAAGKWHPLASRGSVQASGFSGVNCR